MILLNKHYFFEGCIILLAIYKNRDYQYPLNRPIQEESSFIMLLIFISVLVTLTVTNK